VSQDSLVHKGLKGRQVRRARMVCPVRPLLSLISTTAA
jgi:hypothetical protein